MSKTRIRRYPGLNYFTVEQKDQFFGREDEKALLLALVLTEKIVTLFGKSGYGKSSLLRAGLIPLLPADYLPIVVQLGAYQADQSPSPLERTIAQLNAALPDDATEMAFLDALSPEDSLWKRFKKKQGRDKRQFLLIFDQFEEFQTYPAEQREVFKRQLAELLFTRIPQAIRDRSDELSEAQQALLARAIEVRAVFALREDRLSVLDQLADKLPAILHKRFHLKGLDEQQATAAIVRPAGLPQGEQFESAAFSYTPSAIQAIQNGLRKDDKEPTIESFLLQICCEEVERSVIERSSATPVEVIITESELPDFKDLFEQYYRNKIAALSDETAQQAARRMIEDYLVKNDPATDIAYRINADGRALCALPGVDEALLKQLTDFFLLRSEPNTTGGFSYELSHDRLLDGVLVMKKEYEATERERALAAESERIAREKADAERRRKRALATSAAAGILILGAIGASFLAVQKMKQAQRAEAKAAEAERMATQKTQEAATNQQVAQEKTAAAKEAERLAAIDKELAALKTKEAKTMADLAAIKKLEAEKAELRARALLEASKLMAAKKLPENFDALIPLDSLDCSSWHIENLSPEIGKLINLQTLYLGFNDLNSLPAEFGRLKNLKKLDLINNKLDSLPFEFGQLQNLQVLDLWDNMLYKIPASFGQLQNLKKLNLSINNLKCLPAELGQLKNLQTLILARNRLDSLPVEIGQLKNLQYLDLSNNQLSYLPAEFVQLQNLRYLELRGNLLSSLPIEIFVEMPNLNIIVLKKYDDSNPLQPQDIEALRKAMPWCEIVWK